MTKQELIDQLLAAPKHLFTAEASLLNAEQCARSAREALADREASLLIGGTIDGKSADIRAAQMREATESLRAQVEETRLHVEFTRLSAESERAKFSSLRAASRLAAVDDRGMAEILEQVARLSDALAAANAEVCQHIARLEEIQEAHSEAIVRLDGEREDNLRETQARATLANRVLELEATVARVLETQAAHAEGLCALLEKAGVAA